MESFGVVMDVAAGFVVFARARSLEMWGGGVMGSAGCGTGGWCDRGEEMMVQVPGGGVGLVPLGLGQTGGERIMCAGRRAVGCPGVCHRLRQFYGGYFRCTTAWVE